MPGRRNRLSETAFYAVIIVLAAVFTTLVYNVITGKTPRIDIRCVSEMKVSYNTVNSLYQLSARFGLPFDELLGVYMVENRFFPERDAGQTENALERLYIVNYNLIKSKYSEKKLAPYIEIFKVLLNEIKYYPVKWEDSGLYFDVTDEYYEYRSPGEIHGYMFGNGFSATGEQHYGTDVFDRESTPGRLTVVSMTSGTLEEMGENGSYGKYTTVLTDSGTRYYYRNLDSFSDGLAAGMRVNAGQSLGKMGRSGGSCIDGGLYVRLHVGIKIKSDLRSELWINPYIFLRIIEMYADNLYQAAI